MASLTISSILRSRSRLRSSSSSSQIINITCRNVHQFLSQKRSTLPHTFVNFNVSDNCNGILLKNHLPSRVNSIFQGSNSTSCKFNFSTTTTPDRSNIPESNDNEGDKNSGENSDHQVQGGIDESGMEEMTLTLTDEQLQKLTGGDPELLKKVRYIQLEHEILRQEGVKVPTRRINLGKWEELINLQSKSKRRRYYLYLFKIEKSNDNELIKKEERKKQRLEELSKLPELPPLGEDPDGVIYGLNRNTLWMRLYDTTVNTFHHHRLIQEMMFGQPLVIDCGYTQHMTYRESKNCADQLELMFSCNRYHKSPYNLYYCNANRDDTMIKFLNKKIPPLYDPDFPLNIMEKSYLDVFPREKLVYLSPHATDDILELDPDEIYIIGAMVDRTDPRPFSLAKAKKENLKIKRLPLDRFLDWGLGHKSLTLDQMMKIMLDARHYRDWNAAFEHVPKRKLRYFGRTNFEDEDDGYNNQYNASKRFVRGKVDPPQFFKRPQMGSDRYHEEDNQYSRNRNYESTPRYEQRYNEYDRKDHYNRNNANNYSRRSYQDNLDFSFNRSVSNNSNNNYRNRQNVDYNDNRPPQKSRPNVRNLLDD